MLLPDVGIVVLEIKAGSVWFGQRDAADESELAWWQSQGGVRRINPVDQAVKSKYALGDTSKPTRAEVAVTWAQAVVTGIGGCLPCRDSRAVSSMRAARSAGSSRSRSAHRGRSGALKSAGNEEHGAVRLRHRRRGAGLH